MTIHAGPPSPSSRSRHRRDAVAASRLVLGLAAALCVMALPAAAQEVPATRPETGVVHQVRRGDTLWDLARECLGNPYRWPEIYQLNRGIVADPDLIYPRESLHFPPCVDGAPSPGGAVAVARTGARTIFYPDETEELAGSALGEASTRSVPLTTAGAFYRAGVLVHARDIAAVGTVGGVISPTVVPIRSDPQVQPYDQVYLRGARGIEPGDRVHLLRRDREVRPYGNVYLSTGLATVHSVKGGSAVLVMDQIFAQVKRGDIAVPLADFRVPTADTQNRVSGPSGRIVAFETSSPVRQLFDLAFVDLGRQFGVTEGDELEAYLPETQEKWGVRPEIRVAVLRVVRATERTSTALVIGIDQPALTSGMAVRLVARTP